MTEAIKTFRGRHCPVCDKSTLSIFYKGQTFDDGPSSPTGWFFDTARCQTGCELGKLDLPTLWDDEQPSL